MSSLRDALDALNLELAASGITAYKLDVVDPAALLPLEKNAHFMSKRVFDQLVANIRRDGNLESIPFCWKRDDGKYVVLSGNHRREAAMEAGVKEILILYTDKALASDERLGKQLAHNALNGSDNPVVLAELYKSIDSLSFKIYSGLDDELLKTLEPVEIATPREAELLFEELLLLFLPTEMERVERAVKQLGKHPRATVFAARFRDWDRFFDALLAFKAQQKIVNSGTALLLMCEVVEDWLAKQGEQA